VLVLARSLAVDEVDVEAASVCDDAFVLLLDGVDAVVRSAVLLVLVRFSTVVAFAEVLLTAAVVVVVLLSSPSKTNAARVPRRHVSVAPFDTASAEVGTEMENAMTTKKTNELTAPEAKGRAWRKNLRAATDIFCLISFVCFASLVE
jgi:hypothetical protein